MIYLDSAATTPVDEVVIDAMAPYYTKKFGNPGAIYHAGLEARSAVERAREQVASLIGAEPWQIIFTSGGSEANNLAFRMARSRLFHLDSGGGTTVKKDKALISATEHDSVFGAAQAHKSADLFVETIGVSADGSVRKNELRDKLPGFDVGFVSVMTVNNETGAENPTAEIADMCSEFGSMFHTDCVQAAGTVPIDVKKIKCDFLSLSSHKLHGPKGVGALFVRDPTSFREPRRFDGLLIAGGAEQEFGLRGGTENVPGIVGFGKACEITQATLDDSVHHTSALKQIFYNRLAASLDSCGLGDICHVNGGSVIKPGKILNLRFDGVDAETLVLLMDLNGVCVSAGSACRSREQRPSRTLTAMGLTPEQARGSIRVSFSRLNSEDDAVRAAEIAASCVKRLRE